MAKAKIAKPSLTGPQKAMHSRVSYLYQAAAYLATTQQQDSTEDHPERVAGLRDTPKNVPDGEDHGKAMSRRFVTEIRSIVLKAQLRVSPEMKQSLCKNCDSLLVDGSTCVNMIENRSRNGKKPWADVLLRKCTTCGNESRTPLTAQRQKRRPLRSPEESLKSVP